MKKLLLLSLFFAGSLYADDNVVASFGFTGDTKSITLSTTPASPTQIMVKNSFIQSNWIVSTSSFTIYISSFNTTISTAANGGTFSINRPLGTTGSGISTFWTWSPDGPASVYNGQMWAISQPIETPQTISIYRSK